MTSGVGLTYFTCDNLYLSIITYGFIKGFGLGFAYSTPLVIGMRWFKENKGTVNGCIIFGFGAASFIFDLVQTQIINPNNVKQDSTYAFTNDTNVLNNVPSCFIKLAAIYLLMQIIGCIMLSNPKDFIYPSCSEKDKEKHDDKKSQKDGLLENDEMGLKVNENDKIEEEMKADLTEKEVLMDMRFWNLWFTFCLNGCVLTFFSTSWKDFSDSQLNITNDRFLSTMGSISSLFNGLGRIFWSSWMDRNKSYKLTMGLMTSLATLFVATWPLLWILKYIHPVLVNISGVIWLSALFFSICGSFSVFPTQITNVYGSNNNGVVYGLLFSSMLPSAIIGTFGIIYIKKALGYYGTAWSFAVCGAIAFLLALRSKKVTMQK